MLSKQFRAFLTLSISDAHGHEVSRGVTWLAVERLMIFREFPILLKNLDSLNQFFKVG